MIVAKLTVSFDRGVKRNAPRDVGLDAEPTETETGGIVRGIGTHYTSPEAKLLAEACEAEERRIRRAFNRTLLRSPIEGLYLVPDMDAGRALLDSLNPSSIVKARVRNFDLTPEGGSMPPADVAEWVERIRRQLTDAPLGNTKEAKAEGLDVLDRLAACPYLSPATRSTLRDLISSARLGRVERVEFKRRLSVTAIDLDLAAAVQPRRVARPVAGAV